VGLPLIEAPPFGTLGTPLGGSLILPPFTGGEGATRSLLLNPKAWAPFKRCLCAEQSSRVFLRNIIPGVSPQKTLFAFGNVPRWKKNYGASLGRKTGGGTLFLPSVDSPLVERDYQT